MVLRIKDTPWDMTSFTEEHADTNDINGQGSCLKYKEILIRKMVSKQQANIELLIII